MSVFVYKNQFSRNWLIKEPLFDQRISEKMPNCSEIETVYYFCTVVNGRLKFIIYL